MSIARKTRWLTIPLALALFALAGCGDDDDDGNNGTGPTGDGTPITADNAAAVQGQLFSVVGAAAGKGPGTHQGATSGSVKIEISTGKLAQAGGITMAMTFKNFSDDGVNWLDGTVNYVVNGADISYTVDLTISGTYSGQVKGDVAVAGGTVSGSWTVDGQTINF